MISRSAANVFIEEASSSSAEIYLRSDAAPTRSSPTRKQRKRTRSGDRLNRSGFTSHVLFPSDDDDDDGKGPLSRSTLLHGNSGASPIHRRAQKLVSIFTRRRSLFTFLLLLAVVWFLRGRKTGHADLIPEPSSIPSLSTRMKMLAKRNQCVFTPPLRPLPVYEDTETVYYENHPMSVHRPQNQFGDCFPVQPTTKPALTIITATQNPGSNFQTTFDNIRAQSLKNIRWIIVDDHSTDLAAIRRLNDAARTEPRIILVRNTGAGGLAASRNVGLDLIKSDLSLQAPYVVMLDDDDMFELTALEKAVWLLESNPEWSLASFHFVKFGAQNITESRGVHSGPANYLTENYVANAAVIRRQGIGSCRYDLTFRTGGEDWDFWMCLAERGSWGGTLPEMAYWYRVNDKAFRRERWGLTFEGGQGDLRDRVQRKHLTFQRDIRAFPNMTVTPSVALEPFEWGNPFSNTVPDSTRRGSIMLVIPWLFMGGADIGALRIVEILTKAGYRVTVVCTLYKQPEGIRLRPQMMQWTHDVHVLPSFLRAHDFPRYMKYLAESRGIDLMMISNSMLAYEMLPALREQMPSLTVVDYLHNEAYDGWKSGGYPTYSVIHQRYIDHTITCSFHLRQWMIERGHVSDRIGVVKLGVDLKQLSATRDTEDRDSLRDIYFGVDDRTTVMLSVARLDPQKRTLIIPEIVNRLVRDHEYTCGAHTSNPLLMVMVGGGPLEEQLKARIARLSLKDCFHLAGTQPDASDYFAAADLFLLPSMSEGISVAVSEAMAAGLPLVVAAAGALPEQVGKESDEMRAGVLVNQRMKDAEDSALYARSIDRLLKDPDLMRTFSENGMQRVEKADWHHTLKGLLPEFEKARRSHETPRSPQALARLPNPAAHLAIQTQLNEFRSMVDLSLTQTDLSVEPRKGYGRELQLRCGESERISPWIDLLERPKKCAAEKRDLDVKNLRRSAIFQCAQWCVWDLRTSDRVGWEYTWVFDRNMYNFPASLKSRRAQRQMLADDGRKDESVPKLVPPTSKVCHSVDL